MTQPTPIDLDLPASDGQPVLTIDLGAVQDNYRLLQGKTGKAQVAGVVKANGYGCGALEVSKALAAAGCPLLFVTTLDEGLALRADKALDKVTICILNGYIKSREKEFKDNQLVPIFNTLDEYKNWMDFWQNAPSIPPFAVHIDTGMNRLGLSPLQVETLMADKRFSATPPLFAMSHLACADTPLAPQNEIQRAAFAEISMKLRTIHPGAPLSLANSAGIFTGDYCGKTPAPDYCLDLVRPGIALYGGQPLADIKLPLRPVAHLHAPILQIRTLEKGESVGYGATFVADKKRRVATIPLGYADGILRSASNSAAGYIGNTKVPYVGRISMDLITIDITDIPQTRAHTGTYVEILGQNVDVDQLGTAAGSFGYEILTGLGNRYRRRYINPVSRMIPAGE